MQKHADECISLTCYMFKVNSRSTRAKCEICSKLTIKIPGVVLVSLLLISNIFHTFCSSVPIVNFEQVNAGWVSVVFPLFIKKVFKSV